mmetsp:Transcript_7584/g.33829  ORF Transcript_7584/g.33829 Transcript_7584/m.33829 type:complete len:203 (-) Transcript_7584:1872-2480(-)
MSSVAPAPPPLPPGAQVTPAAGVVPKPPPIPVDANSPAPPPLPLHVPPPPAPRAVEEGDGYEDDDEYDDDEEEYEEEGDEEMLEEYEDTRPAEQRPHIPMVQGEHTAQNPLGEGEVLVKTEFVWADGAEKDVKLAGSWNGWMPIQMYHEGGNEELWFNGRQSLDVWFMSLTPRNLHCCVRRHVVCCNSGSSRHARVQVYCRR